MKTYLFPGTFDPFTRGHRDIARRASGLCDRLIIAVMENSAKKPVFTPDEREQMVRLSISEYDNIEVIKSSGLLVDIYKDMGCCAVVRGIRSESDFRYEAEMTLANRLLYPSYETVVIPCRDDMSLISSSIVKEVGHYGGDISKMVPAEIVEMVKNKLTERKL